MEEKRPENEGDKKEEEEKKVDKQMESLALNDEEWEKELALL